MFDKVEGHVLDWLAQLPSDVNKIKGWYDATLGADHWSVRPDITPVDAAMLLCQFNPNDTRFDDAVNTTNDQTGPMELIQLKQRFEDLSKSEPKLRTLRNWHQDARAMGIKYHSWIDGYIEATPETESAQNAAPAAPVEADKFDFNMVVTRKDLIDAFGKFTEMNKTWFKNLTDTPKLKAARKYTGKGGRHSAEPLFCPYEVMQWLVDPKRKKGKKLSDTTAWRMFKNHFPNVYNQYSIGDPNAE